MALPKITRSSTEINGLAFHSVIIFLALNELEFYGEIAECIQVMLSVASGGLSEEQFAAWIRANCENKVSRNQFAEKKEIAAAASSASAPLVSRSVRLQEDDYSYILAGCSEKSRF